MEVDITGSGMEQFYKPGDSIGILPENNPAMVDQIINKLGVDAEAVFSVAPAAPEANSQEMLLSHLKWPCTVRNALLHGCDVTTAPRKSLLRVLAEHCSEETEKNRLLFLCSRQGRDAYATAILAARPTLLDLLTTFSSCKPPLDALLDALPALPPRMYSITCSPLCSPNRIQVAFTIVKYTTATYNGGVNGGGEGSINGGGSFVQREGVATTWLDRLCTPLLKEKETSTTETTATAAALLPLRVPIFLRKGGAFKTPSDLSRPWILIGPGTGVAPFRGFLQERRARIQEIRSTTTSTTATATDAATQIAECWLFFGCRRPDLDYLYESDLKSFEQDKTLTRLEVAFSRAPSGTTKKKEKVYVQHLMAQHSMELYDLFIKKKGLVFVCGDGATMAKDVHATLINIIATGGGVSETEAAVQLTALAREGRYVRDIWS
jgi:NADPH-ferrihemoprotein reductase